MSLPWKNGVISIQFSFDMSALDCTPRRIGVYRSMPVMLAGKPCSQCCSRPSMRTREFMFVLTMAQICAACSMSVNATRRAPGLTVCWYAKRFAGLAVRLWTRRILFCDCNCARKFMGRRCYDLCAAFPSARCALGMRDWFSGFEKKVRRFSVDWKGVRRQWRGRSWSPKRGRRGIRDEIA